MHLAGWYAHCFAESCVRSGPRRSRWRGLAALPLLLLGCQQLSLEGLFLWQREIALGMHSPTIQISSRPQRIRSGKGVESAWCKVVGATHRPDCTRSLVVRPRCLLGSVKRAQPAPCPDRGVPDLSCPLAPGPLPNAPAASKVTMHVVSNELSGSPPPIRIEHRFTAQANAGLPECPARPATAMCWIGWRGGSKHSIWQNGRVGGLHASKTCWGLQGDH